MQHTWHIPRKHGFWSWTTLCGQKYSVFAVKQAKTMTPRGKWCPVCKRRAGL